MRSLLVETVRFVRSICQLYTWTILGHLCGLSVTVTVSGKNLPKLCLYSRPARRDLQDSRLLLMKSVCRWLLKTFTHCTPNLPPLSLSLSHSLPFSTAIPSPVMAAEVTLFFIEINKSKRSNRVQVAQRIP